MQSAKSEVQRPTPNVQSSKRAECKVHSAECRVQSRHVGGERGGGGCAFDLEDDHVGVEEDDLRVRQLPQPQLA
eukprot:348624-Rhodomonas_salina.1